MSKRSKTIQFPRYSLEKCEEWLRHIDLAKSLSKKELSKSQGFTTDISMSASSARAAMTMFGSLSLKKGEYQITDLGKVLRAPVSAQQLQIGRIMSFLHSDKFREFYRALNSKHIESNDVLVNLAAQKYIITDNVTELFGKIFYESGKHCKLIHDSESGGFTITDISQLLEKINYDQHSPIEIQKILFDILSDKDVYSTLLSLVVHVEQNDVITVEKPQQIVAASEIRYEDLSETIAGEKEMVSFRLPEGIYILRKQELIDYIRQKGIVVENKIYRIE